MTQTPDTIPQPPHNNTLIATAFMLAKAEDRETLPVGGNRIIDGYSSLFLIPANQSGSEAVLVDTGMDHNGIRLSAAVDEGKIGYDGLYVYITHAHSDHVGGLSVAAVLPGYAGTSISKADSFRLSGERPSQGPWPSLTDRRTHSHKAAVPEISPRILADNHVDHIGSLAVRTLFMPGHTDGSTSLLITNTELDTTVWLPGDSFDFSKWGRVRKPVPIYTQSMKQSVLSIVHAVEVIDDLVAQGTIAQIDGVYPSHTGRGTYEAVQKFAARHNGK